MARDVAQPLIFARLIGPVTHTTAPGMSSRRGASRLGGMSPFLLGSFAMFTAMYSTQAILPELGRDFAVSDAETGLTISVLIVALALSAWFWGPVSDRIGQRKTLVLSSALLVAPSLATALAPTFGLLLLARAVQGLCMPGLLTVGMTYCAEVFMPLIGPRAMGYYLGSLVAGGLVGRIGVAFLTALVGWRLSLAVVALLPLLATLMMRRSLPLGVAAAPAHRNTSRATLAAVVKNRSLIAATVAGSSLSFGWIAAFSYVGFRLERAPFFLAPTATSLVFVVFVFGAVGPFAGRLSGGFGWRRIAICGLLLSSVGLTITLVSSLPLVAIGLAVCALGTYSGLTAIQLGVTAAAGPNRGLATAFYYSIYYLAGGLGGYLPGIAWQAWGWSGVTGVAVAAFALGLSALVFAGLRGSLGEPAGSLIPAAAVRAD